MKPRATRSAERFAGQVVTRRHRDARPELLRLLAGRQPDRPIRQPKPAPALLPAAIVSTSGLLADDVCRKIRPETGTFGRELWG